MPALITSGGRLSTFIHDNCEAPTFVGKDGSLS